MNTNNDGSGRFTITKTCPVEGQEISKTGLNNDDIALKIDGDANDALLSKGITTPSPNLSNRSDALALYAEDILTQRGRFQNFLQAVSSYTATIPAASQGGEAKKEEVTVGTKLGTLVGVFLPCIQNILGVILFIRLSWIVGSAGVIQAFFIVLICCCCTMLTAISMSAIATNGVVPAGGSYFMISRSLGPEFGGAVGVLFYLGTSFAASMYILGAVEILLTYIAPDMSLFGDTTSTDGSVSTAMLNNMRVYGTLLVILLGGLVFIGVKYVNKCAFLFLACVLLSILAIFIGFFSVHARSSPNACFVGSHLLASSSYTTCSKNDSKLQNIYHKKISSSLYYNLSKVYTSRSSPGINSGVFSDNVDSFYKQSGEVQPNSLGISGEIVADMTTSFTILLAIFFPSVTGIMAGSNRSGNLENAQFSIPRGTIAAILFTSTIYLLSVLFLGATANGDVLRDKFGESIDGTLIVSKIAWPNEWVILIGSLLSTIGAGLQSLTGAPRLLQAIANDGIIPFLRIFSVVSKDGEPKRALMLTLFIAEIGVLIASLDAVAPIITMFFLMCYGFVNFACTLQSLLRLPNWRPRFRFYHWFLSLLGVCLCLALMFISSWYYALIAIIIAGFLYKYIEYSGTFSYGMPHMGVNMTSTVSSDITLMVGIRAEKEWGDGLSGLSLSAARFGLLRISDTQMHTKNWRPQLLVLCETKDVSVTLSDASKKLIELSSQLKKGRGLTIVGAVFTGNYLESRMFVDELEEELQEEMKKSKVKGFQSVIANPYLTSGLSSLIQTAGLGGLKPNTIILPWPQNWKNDRKWQSFIHSVRVTSVMRRALVVVKNADLFPDLTSTESGFMDIWWVVHDGGLMLLMMFLLRQHKIWQNCKLRLFTVAQISDNSIQIKKDLVELLYNLRMTAEVQVIELDDSDISAYTYERTLQAEQRKQMVNRMKLTRRESKKEAQLIVDRGHRSRTQSICHESGDDTTTPTACLSSLQSPTPAQIDAPMFEMKAMKIKPDEENVRRMNTAVKINKLVCEKSKESGLVMINLPKPPRSADSEVIYMEFIEALTEGVKRVFLVRGGGHEVVTIYS